MDASKTHRCRVVCEQEPAKGKKGRYHAECSACGWKSETVSTSSAAEGKGQWHQARERSE